VTIVPITAAAVQRHLRPDPAEHFPCSLLLIDNELACIRESNGRIVIEPISDAGRDEEQD